MRIVAIANRRGGPEGLAPGPFGPHFTRSRVQAPDRGSARVPATFAERRATTQPADRSAEAFRRLGWVW